MCKSLLFYTIDEFTDDIKYCKRKGLKPYKFVEKKLGGRTILDVKQYYKGGYIYDVLSCRECYSGYMLTLMRLPKLSYSELLNVAMMSRNSDERAGALGLILKEHPKEFERYLSKIIDEDFHTLIQRKRVTRMASFVFDFIRVYSGHARDMDSIISLCEQLR